jgi:hypothetical protein
MSNIYRGPSIYVSCQVSVHMVEGFQRRRLKCEKLTDDRRQTPSDGKSSHCIWQGELKKVTLRWACGQKFWIATKKRGDKFKSLEQTVTNQKLQYIFFYV